MKLPEGLAEQVQNGQLAKEDLAQATASVDGATRACFGILAQAKDRLDLPLELQVIDRITRLAELRLRLAEAKNGDQP